MSEDTEHFQTFVRLQSRPTGEWLVDPKLRPKLVAFAEEQESNLTDVVIAILGRRYGVAVAPNGRRTAPDKDAVELNLRLPMPLYQAIAQAAVTHPRSVPDEIRAALCDECGLPVPEPVKRGRQRAAA